MSGERLPKRLIFHWITLKGVAAIILFLAIATLVEYFVFLHAVNLGVRDENQLQCSSNLPGTDLTVTLTLSPLFHLVSIAVVITLASSWTYLTKHIAVKSPQKWTGKVKISTKQRGKRGRNGARKLVTKIRDKFVRVKSWLLQIKAISYLWQKIHFARATVKSALTVLLVFGSLILVVSFLSYPQLIHWAVLDTYESNPSLLGFVLSINLAMNGIAESLASIGWVCSAVNNLLLSGATAFRDSVLTLGGLTKPLVELDNVEKYLVFQNVSSWVSALAALVYGKSKQRNRLYRTGRRP